ncbi:hypothetical protein LNTAR_18475 [Lentisphaera araneosa HTCC2155]|uniref:Uncharacterized protein n=1 Tax=Lentisphaera araneosa HTCC2155 TaxID=313628 RepID=A6DNK1_9BACT|nr:hypothetical protein [Lentisphaera araneosa]EDM26660.1 hypothetical protein LNTAR_18475 [Lentisphaera araneosa HTCC2155]
MKSFISLLLFLCSTLTAQTVLVDHSSDEKDDLWSMGAADLMNFYLQEQGVEVVHRDQLSSMINELSIADAEIAKSDIHKGKWKGAQFLIQGTLAKTGEQWTLKISLTELKNAKLIDQLIKTFEKKDDLAIEVESYARKCLRLMKGNQGTELSTAPKSTFIGLEAKNLYSYYEAIKRIQSGEENKGIRDLIYLTYNAPEFELPYYWLASFFSKYEYKKIEKSLRSKLPIDLSYFNQIKADQKKIFLLTDQSKDIDLSGLLKTLKDKDLSVLSTESIMSFDLEKDLKRWKYINDSELPRLKTYLSSYIIKINNVSHEKFRCSIYTSRNNETLKVFEDLSMKQVIEELRKFDFNKSSNSLNTLGKINSSDVEKIGHSWGEEELMLDLIKRLKSNKNRDLTLWRLMSFHKTKHLRNALWPELIGLSNEINKPFWIQTREWQNEESFSLIGDNTQKFNYTEAYQSAKSVRLINEYKKLAKHLHDFEFTYQYALAVKEFYKNNFTQAFALFSNLEQNLSKYSFSSTEKRTHIKPSLNYWSWQCAVKLNHKLKDVLRKRCQHDQANWRTTISHIIVPAWEYGFKKDLKGLWKEIPITRGWRYTHFLSVDKNLLKDKPWPKFNTLTPSKDVVEKCHIAIALFKSLVNSKQLVSSKHNETMCFLSAVSHLHLNPFEQVPEQVLALCKQSYKQAISRRYTSVLCLLGQHDFARKTILSSDLPDTKKAYYLMHIAKSKLTCLEAMRVEAKYYMKEENRSKISRFIIEECFDYLLLDELKKLLDYKSVNDNSDESRLMTKLYKAELMYLEGEVLEALLLFKEYRKQNWEKSSTKIFSHTIRQYLNKKIHFIETLTQKESYSISWDSIRLHDDYIQYFLFSLPPNVELFLDPDFKKDFIEIAKPYYFSKAYNSKNVKKEIISLIEKYGERKVFKQVLKFFKYKSMSYQKKIATSILVILSNSTSSSSTQDMVINAFYKHQAVSRSAILADKNKAIEIFKHNYWALGGLNSGGMLDICIMHYKIKALYPLMLSKAVFKPVGSDDIFQKLKNQVPEDSYKKALSLALLNISNSIDLTDYSYSPWSLAELAFSYGYREGIENLLFYNQLSKGHHAYYSQLELTRFVNSKFEGFSVPDVKTFQLIKDKISWDSKKNKWIINFQELSPALQVIVKKSNSDQNLFITSGFLFKELENKSFTFPYKNGEWGSLKLIHNDAVYWKGGSKSTWELADTMEWFISTENKINDFDTFEFKQLKNINFIQKDLNRKRNQTQFKVSSGDCFLLRHKSQNKIFLLKVISLKDGVLKLKIRTFFYEVKN